MRTAIARLAKGVLPQRHWIYLQSVRSRNRQMLWLKENRILEFAKQFSEVNGAAVLHGPFAGMEYPAASILTRHSVPRLLGSYEKELHQVIQAALACRYERIVDIGSAEGYYAVGFALKGQSPVVTFETDPRELELCREMARVNNVRDRLSARSFCNPKALRALAGGERCFVLSDCEGYESDLFDDPTVEALGRSDVLIETHGDAYEPLLARFSKTHLVETFTASDRSASEYAELACLGRDAELGICEYRPAGQRWLFARSRVSAAPAQAAPPVKPRGGRTMTTEVISLPGTQAMLRVAPGLCILVMACFCAPCPHRVGSVCQFPLNILADGFRESLNASALAEVPPVLAQAAEGPS